MAMDNRPLKPEPTTFQTVDALGAGEQNPQFEMAQQRVMRAIQYFAEMGKIKVEIKK